MGADYYQCANCTLGFQATGEYEAYCECGNCFCSAKCGKLANYAIMEEPDEDEEPEKYELYVKGNTRINLDQPTTCVICRYEEYTPHTLLESVLKHFNITKEQAVNIWRMEKKNGK